MKRVTQKIPVSGRHMQIIFLPHLDLLEYKRIMHEAFQRLQSLSTLYNDKMIKIRCLSLVTHLLRTPEYISFEYLYSLSDGC